MRGLKRLRAHGGPHRGRIIQARSKAGAGQRVRRVAQARLGASNGQGERRPAAAGVERCCARQVWETCPVGGADAAKEENAVVCCSMLGGLTASGCTCAVMGFAEPDLLAFLAHWSGHCNSVPMWDIYRLACHGTGARRRAGVRPRTRSRFGGVAGVRTGSCTQRASQVWGEHACTQRASQERGERACMQRASQGRGERACTQRASQEPGERACMQMGGRHRGLVSVHARVEQARAGRAVQGGLRRAGCPAAAHPGAALSMPLQHECAGGAAGRQQRSGRAGGERAQPGAALTSTPSQATLHGAGATCSRSSAWTRPWTRCSRPATTSTTWCAAGTLWEPYCSPNLTIVQPLLLWPP